MSAVLEPSEVSLNKYISAAPIRLDDSKLAALIDKRSEVQFDATKHLAYAPPARRYSMTDIGLDPKSTNNRHKVPAVVDFAYTEPFRLLSDSGVEAMRRAVLSKEVLENCPFQVKDGNGAQYTHWQLRNTSKRSKFIKEFWHSPTVNALLVNALDYDIVPTMDFEMGHVNLQAPVMDRVANGVTGWHTDTNCQFVCILMLSDSAQMIGGETAFRKGDGSVAKVKFPGAGWAIMMQGLNVLHSVTEVLSHSGEFGERMSMVTSYQPRDYQAPQNGRIKAIHCLASDADRPQMLAEYASWRLEVLSKRMADLARQVEEDRKAGKFDLPNITARAAEFQDFLDVTLTEVK